MPAKNSYDIKVSTVTNYIADQSLPDDGRYVFSYTISITNNGSVPATLLRRHWIITDANGEVQEVRGEGVVGEQPVLAPGQSFQYTSACPLNTSFGTMHGSYQMAMQNGGDFEVEIAPFSLMQPYTIH